MSDDKTKQELRDQCRRIANIIQNGTWEGFEPTDDEPKPSAYSFINDALDVEFIVNGGRKYLGARVLVAFGGPNIWVNTRTKTVEGSWWGTTAEAEYLEDNLGLDEALAELWSC